MVDFVRSDGGVAEVFWVAVGGVEATAGGDTVGGIIHTGKPTGVVVHATATQLQTHRKKEYLEQTRIKG